MTVNSRAMTDRLQPITDITDKTTSWTPVWHTHTHTHKHYWLGLLTSRLD